MPMIHETRKKILLLKEIEREIEEDLTTYRKFFLKHFCFYIKAFEGCDCHDTHFSHPYTFETVKACYERIKENFSKGVYDYEFMVFLIAFKGFECECYTGYCSVEYSEAELTDLYRIINCLEWLRTGIKLIPHRSDDKMGRFNHLGKVDTDMFIVNEDGNYELSIYDESGEPHSVEEIRKMRARDLKTRELLEQLIMVAESKAPPMA